jgi:hypothetical protein
MRQEIAEACLISPKARWSGRELAWSFGLARARSECYQIIGGCFEVWLEWERIANTRNRAG